MSSLMPSNDLLADTVEADELTDVLRITCLHGNIKLVSALKSAEDTACWQMSS